MSVKIKTGLKNLLEQEKGAWVREWGARWPVALVFPQIYPVAMGNLGFQAVYRLLNEQPGLVCERAFWPAPAEWEEYQRTHTSILSLESQRPLRDFGALAFSLAFEPDYPKVLQILEASGIPLLTAGRGLGDPLVVAGGVGSFLNPEPLAPYVDAFYLGEVEEGGAAFFEFLATAQGVKDREGLLKDLARSLPGVYVPSGYQPHYQKDGTLAGFEPKPGFPARVKVRRAADLAACPTHSEVLTPRSEWGEMFLVEMGRGCGRGCRFCAAGFVYRPPRHQVREDICSQIEAGRRQSGRIGLVGASVSDHPDLKEVCRKVLASGGGLGIGSLRADTVDAELCRLLAQGGVRTITLAPEAGSIRLRRLLNKGLSEEHLVQAVIAASEAGISQVRLYFMVGVPTETLEDVREIPRLVKYLQHRVVKASQGKRRLGQITLSLSCFVPKPFTPLQWAAFLEVGELKRRQKVVGRELKGLKEVRVHTDLPKWAYTQALLARGDRGVGEIMLAAHKQGWWQALRQGPLNPDFFVYRVRSREELFPWDFIDHGINKGYLWEEYQKALAGEETPPCQPEVCRRCGVC